MDGGAAAAERFRIKSDGRVQMRNDRALEMETTTPGTFVSVVKVNSSNRVEMNLGDKMLDVDNAAVNASAGAVSTYWRVYLNGAEYRIPLHATS